MNFSFVTAFLVTFFVTSVAFGQRTAEQDLLARFPQLHWSRAKVEFQFAMKADIRAGLEAGANSDALAFKWAKQMEPLFKSEPERQFFTEGWKMTGRINGQSVNFSRKGYNIMGIPGDLELLYTDDNLLSMSFWVAGSDSVLAALYRPITNACHGPGEHTIWEKDHGKITWKVPGATKRYVVELDNDNSKPSEPERSLIIWIKRQQP
jgi:hypothetical protein